MKTLVVYSSRTGNTEKVARAIAEALGPECVLSRAEDAPPPDRFDFIAFGFGVYRGWPDGELRSYMRRARPRYAGIFLTLGAWPDSDHAKNCLARAEGLLSSSRILVSFACHGALAPDMVKRMKSRPAGSVHGWNEERAARVAAAAAHPDAVDLARARELFRQALTKVVPPPDNTHKAIVASWFGTSVESAEKAYGFTESLLTEAPVVRAYLSNFVRRKLNGKVPSLSGALQQLYQSGIRRVSVLSGLLSAGEEYDLLCSTLDAFRNPVVGFDEIRATRPPLSTPERLRNFLDAVTVDLPDAPVLFMGHGHPDGRSDFQYGMAAEELRKRNPQWYLGCISGNRSLDVLLPELKQAGIRQLELRPFLLVAGEHAVHDLAGDAPDSWKSQLTAAGIECTVKLCGLAGYPGVARYFAKEVTSLE